MRIISLWSPKGGVGKTTLAINLAAAAYFRGLKVILCDLDPQQSAVDVFNDKKLSFTVLKGKPVITPQADLMLLDLPPRIDLEVEGDTVVIPFRASILDIRAVNKAIRFVHHKRIIKCVNSVDVRRQDERLLAMRMYSEGAKLIKDRSVYSRTVAMGLSVFDTKIYGAKDAQNEVLRLFDAMIKSPETKPSASSVANQTSSQEKIVVGDPRRRS